MMLGWKLTKRQGQDWKLEARDSAGNSRQGSQCLQGQPTKEPRN